MNETTIGIWEEGYSSALMDMQKRTCDSCKHIRIRQYSTYEIANCRNEKCTEMFDCDVGEDFCCNKWEGR